SELPEREQLIMSLYYNDELNFKEIAQVLEVSESRVCQIHAQIMVALREKMSDWKEE
ncbi:MAG: RNA polymerase sigma factor FliA, partial [Gammaproteobacteria bacterium]|nr:RNA polymerase sigma factor FliA [Gammaproteobacteria bacterium]